MTQPPVQLPVPNWWRVDGPESDVVVTTRCRIARNLADWPFPSRANDGQLREIARLVVDLVEWQSDSFDRPIVLNLADLSEQNKHMLIAGRLVSPAWAMSIGEKWAIVDAHGAYSILLNEEDHLRLQVILPGLQVQFAYDAAASLLDNLSPLAPFAYRNDLGYLTSSIGNVGTGIRLSALLHLPGLSGQGRLKGCLAAAEEFDCSIRGAFGEHTQGTADFFQVSNRYTFNVEPLRSIDRVAGLVNYFVGQERECRLQIFGTAKGLNQLGVDVDAIRVSVIDGSINGNALAAAISTVRTAVAHGVVSDVHGIAATLSGYLVAFDKFSTRGDYLERQLQTLRFEAQARDALRKLLAL